MFVTIVRRYSFLIGSNRAIKADSLYNRFKKPPLSKVAVLSCLLRWAEYLTSAGTAH